MQAGMRVEAIAVPQGSHATIYVGVGSGNLWKTVNNGITWTPIFEGESTFTIGDVAVSESDPDVVWVGTGETQPRHSGYSYAGTGAFRSTDGGQSWENRGLRDTHHIGTVLIHPTDPEIVYVAALGHFWSPNQERGVFRTTDGGESWERVLFISDHTGVVELAMDPADPRTLYAAAWEAVSGEPVEGGDESGLYRTTDGGDSWAKLGNGLPAGPLGRMGIGVAPSRPSTVYAFIDNQGPVPQGAADQRLSDQGAAQEQDRPYVGGEVYRSDDRGESWRKVNEDDLYDVFGVYGWKFTDVRVSPDNPEEIFILGNRAFHSTDGGRTYQRIGETIVRAHDTHGEIMHLDQHEIWIDPLNPDRILLGNDGGLFQSWDRGESWLHLNNIPAAEFYAIATDRGDPGDDVSNGDTPYRIFGGTQDNAALYGPGNLAVGDVLNDPWENVYLDQWTGGDSFDTYLDPTDHRFVYYEHQHGDLRRMDITDDRFLTSSAQSIRPRFRGADWEWRSGWYTPFVISHYDPFTLYMGGNRLIKSTDRGESWEPVSPDLSDPAGGVRAVVPFGTITMISESSLDPDLLYVGTEGGSDGGASWERVDEGLPAKWVSRVVASAHDAGRVYATFTGFREDDFRAFVFRSDDYGATWRSIAANLPAESVNVIGEDPQDPEILYLGTDLGVYISADGGGSWQALSADLPTTPVHDLEVQPQADELVIATHGRSVFVLELEGAGAGGAGAYGARPQGPLAFPAGTPSEARSADALPRGRTCLLPFRAGARRIPLQAGPVRPDPTGCPASPTRRIRLHLEAPIAAEPSARIQRFPGRGFKGPRDVMVPGEVRCAGERVGTPEIGRRAEALPHPTFSFFRPAPRPRLRHGCCECHRCPPKCLPPGREEHHLSVPIHTYPDSALVHRPVMPAAQQDEVPKAGLAPIRPMSDVVGVGEPEPASRKPASPVPGLQRPPERRRHRAAPAPGSQHLAFITHRHSHHPGIAGDAPGRLRGNASAVFKFRKVTLSLTGPAAFLLFQRAHVYVKHHLVALRPGAADRGLR